MIAYPIGDPIGLRRVRPNRPRIARIGSCRIGPCNYVGHLAFPTYDALRQRCPFPTTARPEGMR
jgi:hypothetical protein